MNVLLRFLSGEAIENCVTCLNYAFDKVIFFCYQDIKDEENKNISSFLRDVCKVNSKFVPIENINMKSIRKLVLDNISFSNNNYFDMTGCEGILQVAMSDIAYEKNIPMHIYDIRNDIVINVDDEIRGSINDVKKRKIKFNIDRYIRMVGGAIDKRMQKDNKDDVNNEEFRKLATIKKEYKNNWCYIAGCLQNCTKDAKNPLHTYTKDTIKLLEKCHNCINYQTLIDILDKLSEVGLITNLRHNNYGFSFDYLNDDIKRSICDPGTVFEMEVYEHEKKYADDCKVGVHLDWDGILRDKYGRSVENNVINEIDVLRLDKYVLTFISCKDTYNLSNLALYELETIASRFGGKYCKKLLVCRNNPEKVYINRAKSIGISVKTIDELLKR